MMRASGAAALALTCFAGVALAQPSAGTGQAASAAAARSDAALHKAEREAAASRRADEERYRRRDRSMKKALGSICNGC